MKLETASGVGLAADHLPVAGLASAWAGVVTFWVTVSTGVLYLNNAYGPLGERGGLGTLVG
ncbi:hypothetical protein GON03_17600 [Nocardioides sp. MAH-18]|uniref:Uncharacterized protein n=1 Tax=Nocardioides agri TaxID=2682843 RepID=A0A6L6XUB2_9ACTN|nr:MULTISPECIES: hypothetical protein [unclassified Nocardioides]MBA2956159.1 hypothetical protein [Nocardioides sp. CGMCC 1.13656]MVQ51004.1 hypothetical protein [Nocardioides sp. MAH-18]